MAEYTKNFNLKKPAPDDFVDVADLNANFDTIDEEIMVAQDGSKQYYGTCTTTAATAAKVVTVEGDFELKEGVAVDVRFTYTNSASSPTLNVNGTGAKAIKKYGSTAPGTYMWYVNSIVRLIYNGTYWVMQNGTTATTTYYGVTKLNSSTNSTSNTEAATPSAVKAAMDKANAAQVKPTYTVSNLIASSWGQGGTYDFESSYPNATYDLEISPSSNCTKEQYEAFCNAMIIGNDSTNIIKALGEVPTVNIPIKIKVVSK